MDRSQGISSMSEIEIGGYLVTTDPDHLRRIWDAEELLGDLPSTATDETVAAWIAGYEAGRVKGEVWGRYKLQAELHKLLGVRS